MSVPSVAFVVLLCAPQGLRQTTPASLPTHFGERVAFVDDFDGDGWRDIVVTAPQHDFDRGRVSVLSAHTGQLLAQGPASTPGAELGEQLWTGDFDGDGWSDVLVSARTETGDEILLRAFSLRRSCELFTLRTTPLVGRNVWIADHDGDGCADVRAYDVRASAIVSPSADGRLAFAPVALSAPVALDTFFIAIDQDVDGDAIRDLAYRERWKRESDGVRGVMRIASGKDGRTLRELTLVPGQDVRELLPCWLDVPDARALAAMWFDQGAPKLRYDRDVDGDGVRDWFCGHRDADEVRVVSGRDVERQLEWSELRVLRRFTLP